MTNVEAQQPEGRKLGDRTPIFTAIQLGLAALLIFACARVVVPFIGVLLWSGILAVMLYPLHRRLSHRLSNRWSAVLIGVLGVIVLAAPMIILATSLASTLSDLVTGLQNHTLALPPPPPRLADVPVVGEKLTAAWRQAAANMPAALETYGPSLRGPTAALVGMTGKLAAAELSFMLSFVIAAILVAYGESLAGFFRRLVAILTGSADRGAHLVNLTASTIKGVAIGVVGVATIQAALLGVGLFAIGFPAAGVVTLVFLGLGIVQVPALLPLIPVILYVFVTKDMGAAVIFTIWMLVAGLSDNILKPILLGRGMETPMPVILLGVIGGMLADGLLGLFVGPAVLSVAYVLFREWLGQQPGKVEAPASALAP